MGDEMPSDAERKWREASRAIVDAIEHTRRTGDCYELTPIDALDAAVRAAFEEGQQHRQDEMNQIDAGLRAFNDTLPLPSWLPEEAK